MSIRVGDSVGDREKDRQHAHHATSNTHIDNIPSDKEGARDSTASIPGFADVASGAIAGTESEKRMGIIQGFKTYPKAVGWSILLSTAIVMEGYDVTLVPGLFAEPQFQKKYGDPVPGKPGSFELSAAWQSGLTNGANVGEIIGLFITGLIAERIGYRWTMITSLFLVACFIFIPFFAQNVQTLLAGEILCGLPWGVFQTLTTAYAAEVMPVPLRCYLTTYVNLCWVFGQLIASGVLRGILQIDNQWAYRIPFALQWMWPVPLIIGCLLAPESPWWCVRQGKIDLAKHNLMRLTSRGRNPDFNLDHTIDMMIHTNEVEKEISAGTRYMDCFKGVNLRRTEITCIVWAIQNLSGSSFMNFSTYFYKQAGLSDEYSFDMSIVQYAIGAIGTIGSWFLMARAGRRTLYLGGLAVQITLLLIIGILGLINTSSAVSWAIGSMLLVYTLTYDLTVGPVCYSLVAEISSTRLRQKTIVLARNFYNFWGIINNVWTPQMLNPTAWNWGAKTGFWWAGWALLCITWTYFRLPEPKGRTYGELDALFERRVSARKFHKTDADLLAAGNEVAQHMAGAGGHGSVVH